MSGKTVTICPVSRTCGACTRIDVPYARQLAEKQEQVASLFDEVAGEGCVLSPILGMDDPFHYRNKVVSPFAPGKAVAGKPVKQAGGKGTQTRKGKVPKRREILCGMYAQHSHRIVAADECLVENPIGRRVIAAVRQIMVRYDIPPYDEDAGTGFMRHAVVRVGHESGEVLVTLVTNGREFTGAKNFTRELVRRCPEVTTVVQNVNTRQTNAILGPDEHVLYGPGFILDTLCGLSFRISSHSFYQVNAVQTEVLYRCAIRLAHLEDAGANGPLTVVDAYCGTGTIGLVAAASGENVQVIGVDKIASAINDARQNARHNGIENAEFVAEDAGPFMRRRAAEGRGADVLLMDPPRAGASPEFLDAVLALQPARIVYISCNPATQVRDVAHLQRGGYVLERIQPVDMFPHTDHVENVVSMTLGGV